MKKLLLLAAAVLAVQAVPALAEAPRGEKGMRMFDMQDANKDGAVSEQEFVDFTKARFAETDANKDGKVTKEEAKAHHEAMRAKWKEHREKMKAEKGEAAPAPTPAQ